MSFHLWCYNPRQVRGSNGRATKSWRLHTGEISPTLESVSPKLAKISQIFRCVFISKFLIVRKWEKTLNLVLRWCFFFFLSFSEQPNSRLMDLFFWQSRIRWRRGLCIRDMWSWLKIKGLWRRLSLGSSISR